MLHSSNDHRFQSPNFLQTNGDVREVAGQFARSLRAAPKISAFVFAKERMDHDPEAQEIMRHLKAMQRQRTSGTAIGSDYAEMLGWQQKLRTNQVIQNFIVAQQEAAEFLQVVNATISQILGVNFGATAGAGAGSC